MGNRDAVRKQQDSSPTSRRLAGVPRAKAGAGPRLARLRELVANFDETLAQCSVSAKTGVVHRARTGSRRIQALVETIMREGGARSGPLKKPAHRWLRDLKRLRRKAGAVRDLDVHRKLMKKPLSGSLVRFAAMEEGARSDGNRLCGLAARLDGWLKEQRHDRAEALKRYLEKHGAKLKERKGAFLAAADRLPAPHNGEVARDGEAAALHDFACLAEAMPVLDAGNLHDFRKAVKRARYVAELGGNGRDSKSVTNKLKRLQDAIGAWHDWLSLTEEAQIALGDDAADLVVCLTIETARHFTVALATTVRLREELLKMAGAVGDQAQRRQPPGRVTATLAAPGRVAGRRPPSPASTAFARSA